MFPMGTQTEVNNGFMDALPSYYDASVVDAELYARMANFQALDAVRRDIVRQDRAAIEKVISGLKFTETPNPVAAVMLFGTKTYDVASRGNANGFAPNGADTNGNLSAAGDVWLNRDGSKYEFAILLK